MNELQAELTRTKNKVRRLENDRYNVRSQSQINGQIRSRLQTAQSAMLDLVSYLQPDTENDEKQESQEDNPRLFKFRDISAVKIF